MLLGGGRYSEAHHIGNDMGKCLGLKVSGRYWEEDAISGLTVLTHKNCRCRFE